MSRRPSSEDLAIPTSQRSTNPDRENDLAQDTLDTCPQNSDITEISSLIQRAADLSKRYEQLAEVDDINKAISLYRTLLLLLRPPGHADRSTSLSDLASHLSRRFNQLGGFDDINEAIVLTRDALPLRPPGHPDRSTFLDNLAHYLSCRYELQGGIDDLNEAIVLARDALSLRTPEHPDHSTSLNNLACHLSRRYNQLGKIDDLNEAIVLARDALSLRPPGHPGRSLSLSNLAINLSHRYNQMGKLDDLDEAIFLTRDALTLPPENPRRSNVLHNLAQHLSDRYSQLGRIDDINEAIVLGRDALSLRPPGHPHRSKSLNNLSLHLSRRYNRLGGIDDLNEAIVLARDALSLQPPGHPHRSSSLNNLAAYLSDRSIRLGEIDSVSEAIILSRDALSLRPLGHPRRSLSLNNLARHLSDRYSLLGGIDDLNEAIVLSRDSLSLQPLGYPHHSSSLHNLAFLLSYRYNRLRGIDDLNEAIVLNREALSPGHPDYSLSLDHLALHLSYRYDRLGRIDDLNEAIALDRDALSFLPPGHHHHSLYLNNLAHFLSCRFNYLGGINDLNEAIVLARNALSLQPPGHVIRPASLNNLAVHLSARYNQLEGIDDLNEAIVLSRHALSLQPPGHLSRSLFLSNLTTHLSFRYDLLCRTDDIDGAIEVKQEIFSLYAELELMSQAVSFADLSAAKDWVSAAEEFTHSTTLRAYGTTLRLLVEHVAALPSLPQHLDLFKSLSSSLAVDAFSACLRNQSPTKAVELLEQGRAVFWGQLTRLRSPLDEIIASGHQGRVLAKEYTRLTSLIRNTLNSPSSDQYDRVCRFNLELGKLVSNIRKLPGFSRFLLPSLFSDLKAAAKAGPVIIMNASEYGCDALIVSSNRDPIHIPLPVMKQDVREFSLLLHTLTRNAKRMGVNVTEKEFKIFLRELWDKVVSHIVNVLQMTCPRNSRVWWCPTAEFTLLPLHAAAPYRPGQKGLSDLYVSSYTTTLAALIHARRPSPPDSRHEKPRFIGINQAAGKGATKLICVSTELDKIGQLVDGRATFTRIEGEDACISTVADKLGKNEWAHFACHGVPNPAQPFETAFSLRDGGFTIQHISQCDLQNSDFAYLSACYTMVGDKESPDEAIHLASAMQFAGFRSIVGTMWAVDDSQTDKVISEFYKLMIDDDGRLDYTRAARALRMTMKKVDIPIDQRVLYIHLGA